VDECPVRLLDEQSGILHTHDSGKGGVTRGKGGLYGGFSGKETPRVYQGDSGGASRFFFCSKASKSDRGEGNTHPTTKSTTLMSWLLKLIAREGQTVLDPFAGSASTGVACLRTGRRFLGIEQSPEYFAIAERRLAAARAELGLFAGQ
jgi:DNA modification methylase